MSKNIENNNQEKKPLNNISDIRTEFDDINLDNEDYVIIDKNTSQNFDSIYSRQKSFYEKYVSHHIINFKKIFFGTIKFTKNTFSYIFDTFAKIRSFLGKKAYLLLSKFKKTKKYKEISKKSKESKLYKLFVTGCDKVNNYLDSKGFSENDSLLHKIIFFYKKNESKFIIAALIILYLFFAKNIVEYETIQGYNNLISIKDQRDELQIKKNIKTSINNFRIAEFFYFPFSLIPLETFQTPKHIIKGGKQISFTANNLYEIYHIINLEIGEKGLSELELTEVLNSSHKNFISMGKELKYAKNEFNKINKIDYGEDLNSKFEFGKKYLNEFEKFISVIVDNYDTTLEILGNNSKKNYLLVFQNADEIRPTGGFMGSMSFFEIESGKILNFETEDIYKLEYDLKSVDYTKKLAPEGLNKITTYLGLRDSNFYVNIADTSETINSFLKNLGYNLDGIIYINNTIAEDYLDLTGEVDFQKVQEKVSSKNFSYLISLLVESKLFKEGNLGTPKQILFDFIDEFKNKLVSDGKYLSYTKLFLDNIKKREIIIYTFDETQNNLLTSLGLDGKIDYNQTIDFTYPVFTSISGNKSDRYINRKFEKRVNIMDDCSYNTTFKITLSHNMSQEEIGNIASTINKYGISEVDKNLDIQGRGDNWVYVKVLLPKNSIIRQSKDYEINTTKSASYVTFYMKTKRGNSSTVTINYAIPNFECEQYSFKFYKQPGIRSYDFIYEENDKPSKYLYNLTSDLTY